MNRILVLLEHRENRRLMSEWLSPRYQVIVPDWDIDSVRHSLASESFDLCIICGRTLDQLEQAVQARRDAEQPILLPFLLATSRPDVGYATRHLWQSVDELIIQPIEKIELQARVEILLRSRQLSLRLQVCESETTQQIAARQQAEVGRDRAISAQHYSDAQFRQMAEIIPSVFWLFDLKAQRPIYVSPAYETIWGRDRDDLYSNFSTWFESIHPDDRERMRSANERCLANGQSDEEYRIIRPDGSMRWIRDRGFILLDEDGQPSRSAGVAEDITDRVSIEAQRRQTEAELLTSEARFRRIFECNMVPMGTWMRSGNVAAANDALLDLIGCTQADLEAGLINWQALTVPEHAYLDQIALEEIAAKGICTPFEKTYIHKSGRRVPILIGAASFVDDPGSGVFFAIDLTSTKAAELELNRVLKLEQAARTEAERANRIKDEFLAVLSHELRTPMNPILGWANLLRQGKLDATKATQAIATIERNAKLQVQLIDDLLDISRILRGKLTLKPLPVALSAVIEGAIETVRLAIEAKAVQLQVNLDPIGSVLGDGARLQQVVWNLLTNAVKFTPTGGRITVNLTQIDNQVQIQVSDTGKGIHPDFLPHVFEHFRQEDGATTRKFGGLGLGLAIVRQIVELHGGTVSVSSPGEGQGATFTVSLPLASQLEAVPSPRSLPSTADLSGVEILVVDDDDDSREFVAFALEQAGAIVRAVASGAEALQIFTQSPPNLLISDIGMPEMDGYMLMRQIRSLPVQQGKNVPAIALTAYAGEADERRAYAVGFQKHLPKPIDPVASIALISELLHAHDKRQSAFLKQR
ncbi:ATP-binding protein [Phormidesmis sp. 146-12]